MKLASILFLIALASSGFAQSDSLVDIFPLAIGHRWVYYYDYRYYPRSSGSYTTVDTGIVSYHVLSSFVEGDSTRWKLFEAWNVVRQVGPLPPQQLVGADTIEIIERHSGRHELVRYDVFSSFGGGHGIFPFVPNFLDSTRVYRYRQVDPGDTISFIARRLVAWFWISYHFSFRREFGLLRIYYNYTDGFLNSESCSHYLRNYVTDVEFRHDISPVSAPDAFILYPNFPNPFNPTTTIHFWLQRTSHVELKVFDLLGRETKTLINQITPAGEHHVELEAQTLPSGLYFYRMRTPDTKAIQTRKMILQK